MSITSGSHGERRTERRAAGGWAALRELAGTMIREKSFFRAARAFFATEQVGRLRLRGLRLDQARQAASDRDLRERREGDRMGADWQAGAARAFPPAFTARIGIVVGSRFGKSWPPHVPAEMGRSTDRYRAAPWAEAFAANGSATAQ